MGKHLDEFRDDELMLYMAVLIWKLRDEILRKPLGLSLFEEELDEAEYIHIGAFDGGALAGVLVLIRKDDVTLQMRQVAVRENMQGCGIGRKLVEFCEKEAAEEDYCRIYLHARKTAVEFYEKLGYNVISDEFFELDIPHREMEKILEEK